MRAFVIPRFAFAAVGLFATSGCSVTVSAGRPTYVPSTAFVVSERAGQRCIHGIPGPDSPYRETLSGPATGPDLVAALSHIPPAARRTAVAAGIEPLLARLLIARSNEQGSGQQSPEVLALRQELAERVGSLETQLIAMEFECDCVRGLIHDVLDEYAESETDRQLALTIASLVVGASTGIAAGLWDFGNSRTDAPALDQGPLITSLVGAVATTALGVAVVRPAEREIVYVHEHNILAPIVTGEDPNLYFPTFVFRLLTLARAEGAPTPRDELIAEWTRLMDVVVESNQRATAELILFGEGGIYDPALLALYQSLLQELGATLDSLARDIDLLSRSIALALQPTSSTP
ncbi:MAG: hypothetical protein IPK60_04835 [Sandaracinaceae bacterium]|nr:hypothetical protein [Sandaracinaceae bacterium]